MSIPLCVARTLAEPGRPTADCSIFARKWSLSSIPSSSVCFLYHCSLHLFSSSPSAPSTPSTSSSPSPQWLFLSIWCKAAGDKEHWPGINYLNNSGIHFILTCSALQGSVGSWVGFLQNQLSRLLVYRLAVRSASAIDRLYESPSFAQVHRKVCATALVRQLFHRCEFPPSAAIVWTDRSISDRRLRKKPADTSRLPSSVLSLITHHSISGGQLTHS